MSTYYGKELMDGLLNVILRRTNQDETPWGKTMRCFRDGVLLGTEAQPEGKAEGFYAIRE